MVSVPRTVPRTAQTNRSKDRETVIQLLNQAKLNSKLLAGVLKKYGLSERYRKLKA
jgi:hypothetical protein